ncbi:hypothetical protein HC928_24605, partial [bacterium]|nr:hypothetical protein [bacterium]
MQDGHIGKVDTGLIPRQQARLLHQQAAMDHQERPGEVEFRMRQPERNPFHLVGRIEPPVEDDEDGGRAPGQVEGEATIGVEVPGQ